MFFKDYKTELFLKHSVDQLIYSSQINMILWAHSQSWTKLIGI